MQNWAAFIAASPRGKSPIYCGFRARGGTASAVDPLTFVETSSYGTQAVDATIRVLGIDVVCFGSVVPAMWTGDGRDRVHRNAWALSSHRARWASQGWMGPLASWIQAQPGPTRRAPPRTRKCSLTSIEVTAPALQTSERVTSE